ncbi:MAG: hypothetical protein LBB83_08210, partial [Treponema sp.]|nr:hypothetical protein [Treponema sp.]
GHGIALSSLPGIAGGFINSNKQFNLETYPVGHGIFRKIPSRHLSGQYFPRPQFYCSIALLRPW